MGTGDSCWRVLKSVQSWPKKKKMSVELLKCVQMAERADGEGTEGSEAEAEVAALSGT